MPLLLLLLLSHFSRVRLCATPWTAAHQAPPSLGFSRQEHWSGLPFPSPMHESEKWKWVAQSCPTPSNPMDCSPPGSSIHGIFQARVLEWGAIAFSCDAFRHTESHSVESDSLWPHGLYSPQNSPGQNNGVGTLSLLHGIFPAQGLNPGFPHCKRILYQLSHKGSPRMLEWVAYPFSSGSSEPRNQTRVSCIAGRFFTNWATRKTNTNHALVIFQSKWLSSLQKTF